MLLAMTSLSEVKRCWVDGGSAKTDGGSSKCGGPLKLGCSRGVVGVTGVVTGVAGDELLSSGGGNVGIFSMTEGGESVRSGSVSGSDSCCSEVSPNLLTLLRRVDRGMP